MINTARLLAVAETAALGVLLALAEPALAFALRAICYGFVLAVLGLAFIIVRGVNL